MHTQRPRGVIAAIATPLTPARQPDVDGFVRLARYLLGNGCDGLNVLGTTGEATSLSLAQRLAVMRGVAGSGLPLERLLVGTGAAALDDAVTLTREAAALGFAGALVLPPFYYKGVPDAGVVAYVGALVEAAEIPIYLYNFPSQSGVPYTLELVRGLLERFGRRIAGVKDSSGDLAYADAIAALSSDLHVFPSSEAVLMDARNGRFAGCISATANVNSEMCARAFHHGDAVALKAASAIRNTFAGKALVPGVKAILARMLGDPRLAEVLPPLVRWEPEMADAAYVGIERLRGAGDV